MIEAINRRRFMAAAASTGLALGLAPRTAPGIGAEAGKRLVVGVMGTGGRGTTLATTCAQQPAVEVAYVCDVDKNRVGEAAEAVSKVQRRSPQGRGGRGAACREHTAIPLPHQAKRVLSPFRTDSKWTCRVRRRMKRLTRERQ